MTFIPIGAVPACEDCGQFGHTPDFLKINRLEAEAFRAALRALHGPEPCGAALVLMENRHDFGPYLEIDDLVTHPTRRTTAYLAAVQNGFDHWHQAGFTAPVDHRHDNPDADARSLDDAILGALVTSRPTSPDNFPLPVFATLHSHLRATSPAIAERFDALDPVPT